MGIGSRAMAQLAALVGIFGLAASATAEETKPTFSVNGGFTTDYVFRGFSQSTEDPAMYAGADVSYGIFYAGVWTAMIDFGPSVATAEVDLYAGIKKTFGMFSFDLGAIYYLYPGAADNGAELDYVELKAGISTTYEKITAAGTVFYSPEYTGKTGETVTLEGKLSYELPGFQSITPTIGGTLGSVISTETNANFNTAFGDDTNLYWNAGISFGIDKLTLDFRYWDTDVGSGLCKNATFQCDERFVFTAGVAF